MALKRRALATQITWLSSMIRCFENSWEVTWIKKSLVCATCNNISYREHIYTFKNKNQKAFDAIFGLSSSKEKKWLIKILRCGNVGGFQNISSCLFPDWSTEKACDWMVQAASGIRTDRFMTQQLFPNVDLTMDADRLTVLYFIKVIQVQSR